MDTFEGWGDREFVRNYCIAASRPGETSLPAADEIRAEMVRQGYSGADLELLDGAAKRWASLDRVVARIIASKNWDWLLLRSTKEKRSAVVTELVEVFRRQRAERWRRRQEQAGQLKLF